MKWFFLLLIVLAVFGFLWGYQSNLSIPNSVSVKKNANLPAVKKDASTAEEKVGNPMRIQIPKINVDAKVEEVGLDEKGNMDVPKTVGNTAWYNLGPKPGEQGSAVIAGHLDTSSRAPSVFWDLKTLQPDDKIIITDDQNKTLTFSVTQEKAYQFDQVPLKEVFGATDAKRLNLITCGGSWDQFTHNYSNRVVVYAKMK